MNASSVAHLIDVGSTWTKGLAVALPGGELLARHQHPTTLAEGIMQGVGQVVEQLSGMSDAPVAFRAATSSAAGGLRVAAIGLVPDLTGVAARQASLGAGARVVFSGSFVLAPDEIEALRQARPDIVLLSGGTDGGNTEVITRNARLLAEAALPATVVLAGNKSARSEVQAILRCAGYEVRIADNVLPSIDTLRTESAQAAIRDVFLERIVHARGIDALRTWASGGLLPTPRAVLDAAAFLAEGPGGLGMLVVVDIGGATTDVHSIGGSDPPAGTLLRGLAEPHHKRTVEGDLGLRVSATAAADALGVDELSRTLGTSNTQLLEEAQRRVDQPATVQEGDGFDRAFTIAAVAEALRRHAGRLERSVISRETWFQVGKDLRPAKALIASGGVFAARADARDLLAAALQRARDGERLLPEAPQLYVDRDYVLFAVGLLAAAHPDAARALALRSLSPN